MMRKNLFSGDDLLKKIAYKDFARENKSVLRLARRIYRRSESLNTVNSYIQGVKLFVEYTEYSSADQLLEASIDWEAYLNDFIDYLLYERKASRATVALYIAGVRRWLKINDVKIDADRVETPQVWMVERDRLPKKDELKKIFKYADLQDKVILLLAMSTGLRRDTLTKLKLQDVKMDDVPLVRVRPEAAKDRPTRGYITFMTPEAREYLTMYLDYRRDHGEELDGGSPLIGYGYTGRHVNPLSITRRWGNLLDKVSLNERGRKWRLLRFHTLRKYF